MYRLTTLILIATLMIGGTTDVNSQSKRPLSLEDIYASDQFKGKTVSDVQWFPDGTAFTFTRTDANGEKEVLRHFVSTGREELILKPKDLFFNGEYVKMSAFYTTGISNMLLISGPRKQIWRHSYSAPYFLFNIATKQLTALANGDSGLQNVDISPDGRLVAYVKDYNLYVTNIATSEIKQLTSDGTENILNGIFDWVYEEEFGRADALRWSPDSKSIAFWHTDQTRVKSFVLLDELPTYSQATYLKYPKVGEQNAVVKIGVVDIESGKTVWMDTGKDDDIYIPRIDWANTPNTLAVQRLNRKQNRLELLMCYTLSGKSSKILTDANEAWVDVTDDFYFLKKDNIFLWTSEKSGYRHIYFSDYNGNTTAITTGDWEVSSIIGVDEDRNLVYFYGKKSAPIDQHIYRIKLDGSDLSQVSDVFSWNVGNFSPNYDHYVSFSSNVRTPTKVSLREADGKLVRILEDNKIAALNNFDMVYPQFMVINTNDGVKLNAYMMKPANFNPEKRYPVLVFGYGGPGSQMVIDRWGGGSRFRHVQRNLWHQYMTEKGYIVFCIDNRGTGGQGKAFKNLAYGDLSKWAVHDQIVGARYLKSLAYVDSERIGFWGWSGGGYLSLMLMTRATDFFKAGVSVAPVSDFRNYDTIWTERYMGLLSENKSGYDAADALSYTDQLKGSLLIIHGSGDDNVHPQNMMQYVDALVEDNKQFEMMLYPNRNHRISGGNTSLHLFTKITSFFLNNL